MNKRDVLTPIGITLGIVMVMFGIISSAGVKGAAPFADAASILIDWRTFRGSNGEF